MSFAMVDNSEGVSISSVIGLAPSAGPAPYEPLFCPTKQEEFVLSENLGGRNLPSIQQAEGGVKESLCKTSSRRSKLEPH
ncbi:hypothetical protein ACVWWG_009421 [Bradyrhizobium sp. LB7.2]